MSGLYGDLWQGPTYRPVSQGEQIAAAFDQPMNMGATFWDQAKGGVVESFGLGTELRRWQIPEGNLGNLSPAERLQRQTEGVPNPIRDLGELGKTLGVIPDTPSDVSPDLSEDAWKSSPYYRAEIPWDPSMTEARAQALAAWHDTAKTREYFASKRPITAFLGNIAGQAVDPINYIPLAGQVVKEANLLRMALSGATDAAANTAIFDLATRDARARYGDDVSWQTTISQIATAALIGGAFGGVVGAVDNVLSTRAAARAQADLVPVKAAQEARIALNEAIDAVVHAEPVRLTPNATDAIASYRRTIPEIASVTDRSWANMAVEGQSVITPTGLRVGVRAEVVDAGTLLRASGDLQPRDRSRAASDAQIADMAANLDPARLMPSPEADRGAPIVGPDGVVESGNGRVAAIRRAAEMNPDKFAEYVQAIRDAGFDVPNGGTPILVMRRVTELSPNQRVQFVNDANTSAIARMSATETALMDVRAMTQGVLDNYVIGEVNAAANRAFVQSFLRNLPPNERAPLVDSSGRLNAEGVRRVENAMIAAAYGDADIVARFAETPDDNVKAIMGALSDASAEWASMRREFAQGLIDSGFDVTANLTDAIRFLSKAREDALAQKRSVSLVIREMLDQIDLLAGDIDPRTKAFIRAFYRSDQYTQAVGRDIIAERLRNVVRAARDLGKPQLFGDATAVSPAEMIASATQVRQSDNLGPSGARQGDGADGRNQGVDERRSDRVGSPQSNLRLDVAGQATPPQSRIDAEPKVGKPETAKSLAEDHAVEPSGQTYPEVAEIDQLRIEGRLSDEDLAELDAADSVMQDGDAYGNALEAVTRCML